MPDKSSLEKIPSNLEQSRVPETPESKDSHHPEKRLEQFSEQETDLVSESVAGLQLPTDQSDEASDSENAIILHKVENILSAGMDQIFLEMDATKQREFKIKGEETAHKITLLLRNTKVKIKEIISLIMDWLRVIPKVNKFYLEQEAKIKADAIIKMHKK